jgi:uncharacterized protein (TIGR03086 family)
MVPMSDKLRRFQRAVYGFDAVVRRVPPDKWDAQSPCPDWTARDVVGHQVGVMSMVAAAARGEDAPWVGEPREAAGDDPAAAWAKVREELLDALDHQGALQREADTPFGRMTVDRFLGMLYVDPLTHTWDLATAVGVDPALDEELCRMGQERLARAGDLIRGPGMYGKKVEVGEHPSAAALFVAETGRDPKAAEAP